MAKANAALARTAEAVLCFGHCERYLLALQNSDVFELVLKSALALSYYHGLDHIARTFKVSSLDIQRLLGFEPIQPGDGANSEEKDQPPVSDFWLFSSSIMFENAREVLGEVEPTPFTLGISALVVPEPDVRRLATEAILSKLKSDVRSMYFAASNARYLQPCLDFAIFGKCTRSDCGRHEVKIHKLSAEDRQLHFNIRVRAHMLQILIVDVLQAKTGVEEREHRAFKW